MQTSTQIVRLLGLLSLFCLALAACTPATLEDILAAENPTTTATLATTSGATPNATPEMEVTLLFVGPEQIDCVGETAFPCLRVREDGQAAFENFYDPIEGFNWEPGFEYELRASVTRIQDPQASFATLQYVLLEIVTKTPAAAVEDE